MRDTLPLAARMGSIDAGSEQEASPAPTLGSLRVAHLIDGLATGGAEALLAQNLAHLVRLGGTHRVVTLCRPGSKLHPRPFVWQDAITKLSVPVFALDCASRDRLGVAVVRLARWLSRERIDVLHSHLFFSNLVAAPAARLAGVPLVASLHTLSYEPEVLATYAHPRSWKHSAARAVEATALRAGARLVLAVGDSVAASAIARLRVPPARVRVIHNPVDVASLLAPGTEDARAVRAEIGAQGDPLLLVVGRVMPAKGQLDAVKALEHVPGAHLALVGPVMAQEYADQIRDFAASRGLVERVHLLGARDDVPRWLRAADVFVFPTRYEGLPLALAEAAVAGCACVATDIAANREVIRSRAAGRLVPVGDVGALGDAVTELLADATLRGELGRAAAVDARARFSPTLAAERLAALYVEIGRENGTRGLHGAR